MAMTMTGGNDDLGLYRVNAVSRLTKLQLIIFSVRGLSAASVRNVR